MQIVLQSSFFLHIFRACCGFSLAVSASGSNNGRLGEPPDLFVAVVLCGVVTAKRCQSWRKDRHVRSGAMVCCSSIDCV